MSQFGLAKPFKTALDKITNWRKKQGTLVFYRRTGFDLAHPADPYRALLENAVEPAAGHPGGPAAAFFFSSTRVYAPPLWSQTGLVVAGELSAALGHWGGASFQNAGVANKRQSCDSENVLLKILDIFAILSKQLNQSQQFNRWAARYQVL
jgi:hypothetical protein